MPLDALFAFVSITLLLSASPGPAMINAMTDAARYGLARSFASFMGVSLGNLCLILLSALGVALVLEQFPGLFYWIRTLGAMYLVYLGIKLFRSPPMQQGKLEAHPKERLFLKGFLIAITNPKGIIYFGAFFPQFIDTQAAWAFQYALLTLLFLLIDISWMYIYAIFGRTLSQWMVLPRHQEWFNKTTGSLLIAAGIGLGLFD
jgi:homoserine/homoserine lactone efflux protein